MSNKRVTYKFMLENDNLDVYEEVVIGDLEHNHRRALRDAYTIFINRLLESDEGWKVVVEKTPIHYTSDDQIDVINT